MKRRIVIGLFVALIIVLPANAQGLSEFGAVQAGAAGMGAGLAASQNHGALLRNTYETAIQAQSALAVQNRAIQQYLTYGQAYEAKKQWAYAEQAFTYVLQVICKRDGPGSPAAVPALKHLVAVSKGQNKLDSAINYQKTVVAFTHSAPKLDVASLLKEERSLTDMYLQKNDFANAEPVLQDAVKVQEKMPKLTPEQRTATLKVYGRVLRELNKIEEADAVDVQVLNIRQPVVPETAVSVQPAAAGSAPATAAAPTGATSAVPAAVSSAPTDLAPAPVSPSASSAASASPSQGPARVDSDLKNSGTTTGAVAPVAATSLPAAAASSVPAAAASSVPAAAASSLPAAAASSKPATPVPAAAESSLPSTAVTSVPVAAQSSATAAATSPTTVTSSVPPTSISIPAEPASSATAPSAGGGGADQKPKSPEAGEKTPAEKAN